MPPFVFVMPQTFKAGHTTNMELMTFTENSGNISIKYYNYTRQYYPENTYEENILMEETYNISREQKTIAIPIEVPEMLIGSHVIEYSGYMDKFGPFHHKGSPLPVRDIGYKSYVQTDKPVYKPGQPVRFRGFSVDSDLKGVQLSEGLKVVITNSDNIEVFNELIFNDEGIIHQGTFLLAEEAKTGTYKIRVTGKNTASCTFAVKEYDIPKFGVEIEGPTHIAADDTVIRGKVTATYTYGKPVNGQVVLKFAVDNKSQKMYSGAYHFKELTTELVDGEAAWEVDITDLITKRLKYLFSPFCTSSVLVIAASISDSSGGFQVEKIDSSTKFSQTAIKISFNENTQKNYAAGFPYYVELDVNALTSSNVESMPVKLTMISGISDREYVTKEVVVKNGKAYASFDVPDDSCAVKITAEMAVDAACDTVFACFQPERLVTKTKDFVRFIKTQPVSYRAGETASYQLLSSKAVDTLLFVVLSKGNIVKSWNEFPSWEEHESGKLYAEGSLTLPEDIMTRSKLIMMAADNVSGYIIAGAIDLSIEEDLTHKISLHTSKDSFKPGENITVHLNSDPRSFIGITVNDANLELIEQPCKVLTKTSTLSFLRNLDGGSNKDLSCQRDDPYQCKIKTKVKIIGVNDLLNGEGLRLHTNMMVYEYDSPSRSSDSVMVEYSEPGFERSRYEGDGDVDATATAGFDELNVMDSEEAEVDEAEIEDLIPKLKNNFPETWLWTDTISDENGMTALSVAAPETISGWKGSAFGLSPTKGLGFSNEIEFNTFLPFFIELDLPYSGVVGETITLPIRLFNYFGREISADVNVSSKLWDPKADSVTIPANGAATIDYEISLTEVGNHDITVTAETTTSTGEFDTVQKYLLVQPVGEKIIETGSLLIMQKEKSTGKEVMRVRIPSGFVPGSHRLKFAAVGDILGEALAGISTLIQLPSGSGEQNFHHVAVNVFVGNYIKSLYDMLPENLENSIEKNLNTGLQQQLAYRSGSTSYSYGYSIFKGGPTSDWLTAFVNKIIAQFPKDLFVPCDSAFNSDRDHLLRLITQQTGYNRTVSLVRKGWAPHQYSDHDNRDLYWQTYFLISLLESNGVNRCGSTLTESSYYSDKLGKVCGSTLDLASRAGDCCYYHMVAYSLQLCIDHGLLRHTQITHLRNDDECLSHSNDGAYKFPSCGVNVEFEDVVGSSKAIEAAGYAALYFIQKDQIEDSLPLIMWLASQRNQNGGFRSSQDTVIGIQALARFAEASRSDMRRRTDMTIVLGMGGTYFEKLRIKEEKKMIVKEINLNPEFGEYKIKWNGVGLAFVQLISQYHISGKRYQPLFTLEAAAANYKGFPTVKVAFQLPIESGSTMYLLELASPTGMVFTKSLIEGQLQMTDGGFSVIARYDIKEGGQRLYLYLDPLTRQKDIDLLIPMAHKFEVLNKMPAQVSLIDYYDPSKRQTVFYSIDDSDTGIEALNSIGCSLALSCELLQSAKAIVLGFPGKVKGDSIEIKNAFPYKECEGSFVEGLTVTAKFDTPSTRQCAPVLRNARSFFLLRYSSEGDMLITGLTAYELALPTITECLSVVKLCI
ncbi:hypothetical protein ACHWQZ_G011461 [Mnemiopsis leidyi]